jgi:excisionase family DNA binding protein
VAVSEIGESLLSPEDVARRCGLSRRAVYRAIERGELPASRLCSRLRIRPTDLDAWIAANRVESMRLPELADPTAIRGPIARNGLRRLLLGKSQVDEEER